MVELTGTGQAVLQKRPRCSSTSTVYIHHRFEEHTRTKTAAKLVQARILRGSAVTTVNSGPESGKIGVSEALLLDYPKLRRKSHEDETVIWRPQAKSGDRQGLFLHMQGIC